MEPLLLLCGLQAVLTFTGGPGRVTEGATLEGNPGLDTTGHQGPPEPLQDLSGIPAEQGAGAPTEEGPLEAPDSNLPLEEEGGNDTLEEPGTPTREEPGTPTPEELEQPGIPAPEQPWTPTPEVPGTPAPVEPGTHTSGTPTLEELQQRGTTNPEDPETPTPEVPGTPVPEEHQSAAPEHMTDTPLPSKKTHGPTYDPKGRAATPLDRAEGQTRASTAFPYCICDLSPGACDINCCCDSDCGDTLTVFSSCLPGSTKAVSQVCVESTLIFRNNTPLMTTNNATATPNQFCVQLNDSNLNFFINPRNVTVADFPGLVAEYGGSSFSLHSQSVPTFPLFYKVGDPILTLSNSSTLGFLRQPTALGPGGACVDTNPAGFLESQSTSCVRTFTNLISSCTRDPALSAASYYKSFTILKVPSAANSSSISAQVPITSASAPESPSLIGSICINVVSQVTYVIEYNGTQGIQKVSIFFTLTNLSGNPGSSLFQSFSVLFRTSQQSTRDTVQRSGNPGYLIGAPLLASVDGTRQPVTLMQSQIDGTCSDTRTNTLFRTNMRTGCRFSEVALDSCKGFSEQLHQALLGTSPPQTLAMFGNADPAQADNWTQIIYKNCTNQTEGNCSTGCIVPVSLEIQVLWILVGLRSNPQAQVLSARFQNHCKLLKCQSPVVLEAVLSFIDTTLYPERPLGQPANDWKLPFDFFFPFKAALSGGSVLGRDLSDTVFFTSAALIFHSIIRL